MSPTDASPASGACIFDDAGPYYVEKEYAELGVREGWLKLAGYFLNEYGYWTFHYEHSHPP